MHKYMLEYAEQMISCYLPNFKPIDYITVCQEGTLELTFKIYLTNFQSLKFIDNEKGYHCKTSK